MQNLEEPIAGNQDVPVEDVIMHEEQQQAPAEETKSDRKSTRTKKAKKEDNDQSKTASGEKVKKPRQTKKTKTGEDGVSASSETTNKNEEKKKEKMEEPVKKRNAKQENKKELKQGQLKIESTPRVTVKEEVKIQSAVAQENDLPTRDDDVKMEEPSPDTASLVETTTKKNKMEKKAVPKKVEPIVVLPEKVLEWKAKKDQFATILRELLNKGIEGREKLLNNAALEGQGAVEQYGITDDLKMSIQNKLIRISDESISESEKAQLVLELKLDILKVISTIIESSHLPLKSLSENCSTIIQQGLDSQTLENISKLLDISDLICTNAERKAYGIRDKLSVIYECESQDALWYWELSNPLFLSSELQKSAASQRKNRAALLEKIRCLDKLTSMIDKATSEKDLPKIVDEQEKYNKIIRKENSFLQQQMLRDQQQKEKDQKERERLELIQKEKDSKEQERLQKEQEKIQREQERLKFIRDKEEQKERERIEREEKNAERAKQKELERLEKIQKQEQEKQQRLELKRKLEEEAKAEVQNPHPTKQQKTAPAPVQTNTLFSMKGFQKAAILQKPENKKQYAEDNLSQGQINSQSSQKKPTLLVFPQPFILQNPSLKASQFIESDSIKIQRQFRKVYGSSFIDQHNAYRSSEQLKPLFQAFGRQFDNFIKPKERRKCIIIEDSFMKYFGVFDKKSALLDPRKPLMKDETIIDYDMSSEEEWNEQNGEDVDKNDQEGDAEDDEIEKILQEESQSEGFIVPDDYLSASEFMLSQNDGSQVQQELQERRQAYAKRYTGQSVAQNLSHYVFMQDSKERGVQNYIKDYKAVAFPKVKLFPIKVKNQNNDEANEGQDDKNGNSANKFNPKAINMKLTELVKMMHGSFQSKQKIIEDFNIKNPECSRKSIEKKMRDLFEKDKKAEDPRQRWYATESTLIELNLTEDDELKALFAERLDEVMEEIRKADEESLKIREEKKAIILQQKQEKLELKQQEAAAAKALQQQQLAHVTPNKQLPLQFKEIDSTTQKQKFVMNLNNKVGDGMELEPSTNVNIIADGEKSEKQSCEKNSKSKSDDKDVVMKDKSKDQDKQKKNPSLSLTRFFKPMDNEQKMKILEAELQKVKQEMNKQQTISDLPDHVIKEEQEAIRALNNSLFTNAVNLSGKQTQADHVKNDKITKVKKLKEVREEAKKTIGEKSAKKRVKPNGIAKKKDIIESVKTEQVQNALPKKSASKPKVAKKSNEKQIDSDQKPKKQRKSKIAKCDVISTEPTPIKTEFTKVEELAIVDL